MISARAGCLKVTQISLAVPLDFFKTVELEKKRT